MVDNLPPFWHTMRKQQGKQMNFRRFESVRGFQDGTKYIDCFEDGSSRFVNKDGSVENAKLNDWLRTCENLVKEGAYREVPVGDEVKPEVRYFRKGNNMNKTLGEAYATMQTAFDAKVGDEVKVLRKAKSKENGWGQVWSKMGMDSTVGKTLKVKMIHPSDGYLLENDYYYPFFVLEPMQTTIVKMEKSAFDELCIKTFGYRISVEPEPKKLDE